jgi:hypothetical protein
MPAAAGCHGQGRPALRRQIDCLLGMSLPGGGGSRMSISRQTPTTAWHLHPSGDQAAVDRIPFEASWTAILAVTARARSVTKTSTSYAQSTKRAAVTAAVDAWHCGCGKYRVVEWRLVHSSDQPVNRFVRSTHSGFDHRGDLQTSDFLVVAVYTVAVRQLRRVVGCAIALTSRRFASTHT